MVTDSTRERLRNTVEDSVRDEMMKRLLLGLMLLVTAGAASAEWTRVDDNDKFIQLIQFGLVDRVKLFLG